MVAPNNPNKNPPSILEGPTVELERMYIESYLKEKGYQLKDLRKLPKKEARRLMAEACTYASMKLAEVESRAKFVRKIHYP